MPSVTASVPPTQYPLVAKSGAIAVCIRSHDTVSEAWHNLPPKLAAHYISAFVPVWRFVTRLYTETEFWVGLTLAKAGNVSVLPTATVILTVSASIGS